MLRNPVRPWSTPHVVLSLLRDARRLRDRRWITTYFAGRRGPGFVRERFKRFGEVDGALELRELAAPLHLTDSTGGLATYYEIVHQRVYAPLERFAPQPGQVVIDAGANIGVYSLWAASRIGTQGRLVAVEPHPEAYRQLCVNLAPFEDVAQAFELALSANEEVLDLLYVPGRLSVSSLVQREDRTIRIPVQCKRLDDVIDEAGVEHIDLLKIDVEGVERAVLEGADRALSRATRVVLEYDEPDLGDAAELLAPYGFEKVAAVDGIWGVPTARIAHFERPADSVADASYASTQVPDHASV